MIEDAQWATKAAPKGSRPWTALFVSLVHRRDHDSQRLLCGVTPPAAAIALPADASTGRCARCEKKMKLGYDAQGG